MGEKNNEGMLLSDKILKIKPSGVRKIFDLANRVKNPINLSIGEPDFDIPSPIKEEGIRWIREGFNKYTPSGGIPELREKILVYLKSQGIICDDVIVTPGVTGGLLLALMVILNPSEEVIIPDPYFVLYEYQVYLLGGRPVFIDTYPDFKLKADLLREKINKKTRVILINSPNNPTGTVLTKNEVETVVDVALEFDLIIFSDQIYDRFLYDDNKPFFPGMIYDKTLTFGGFSKTWGMTGWRLGYVAGPKEIIQAMITMQQYVFSSVNSFAQKAALLALDYDMGSYIDQYKRKRDLIYEGLKDKYNVVKPEGAYFIFPESPDGDGDRFVERALKNNLFIIPGSIFSQRKSHMRVSFAVREEMLLKGIETLRKMA
ncbi:MAG: aminotransferase class I/II-fold pyridoxal phosphate-dependent enzyme [Syntrophorhabdaceae bacterium]|nr:aminotransferase class I/II-fold pyridoxal phosphate-dependent enzyme [Syntrophorhabdaceae bacterium]